MGAETEPRPSNRVLPAGPLPRAGWGAGPWPARGAPAAACSPTPRGGGGVAGPARPPGVSGTPPREGGGGDPPRPAPAVPPELTERVQGLQLTDVIDIALRNNSATAAAWADARAAAATYGAARGQYYPTISLDGAVTAIKTVPSAGRSAVQQQFYGPTLNLSWLLFDLGGRSGSIGEAREALLAADWTHNAVIQNVVLGVESAYFGYMATKALLVAQQTTLKEAQANLQAAEERHRVARAQALPSLVVSGSTGETYFLNTSTFGNSYTASIAIQIPLFSGWSRIYGVKAAAAAARAAEQRAHGMEQQVIFQVFDAYYGLRTATQQVRTSADLLASATQSEDVALGRYKAGAGSLLDLLTAQAALSDARAQAIQARFSWYTALAQLAHDAGILGLDGRSPLHVQPDSSRINR